MLDGNVSAVFNAGVSILQNDDFSNPIVRSSNPSMSAVWGTAPFAVPISVGITGGAVSQIGSPASAQQVWEVDYAFTPRIISRTILVFTLRFPVVPSLWVLQSGVTVALYAAGGTLLISSQVINLANSDISSTKTIDISITPQNIDTVRVTYKISGVGIGFPPSVLAGFATETTQFYIWEEGATPPGAESPIDEILTQPVTTKNCVINTVASKSCLTVGQSTRSDIL